jgi:hypothetical protein
MACGWSDRPPPFPLRGETKKGVEEEGGGLEEGDEKRGVEKERGGREE